MIQSCPRQAVLDPEHAGGFLLAIRRCHFGLGRGASADAGDDSIMFVCVCGHA